MLDDIIILPRESILIGTIILLLACDGREDNTITEVKMRLGKELNTVDSLRLYSTSQGWIKREPLKDYNVAIFIDGTCSSCVVQLDRWKELLQNDYYKEVGVLFFVRSYNLDYLDATLKKVDFTKPVLVDLYNSFYNLNDLSDEKLYHTFLFDKEKEIILVGNPLYGKPLENLYREIITKKDH
jgi:hypothetical protein